MSTSEWGSAVHVVVSDAPTVDEATIATVSLTPGVAGVAGSQSISINGTGTLSFTLTGQPAPVGTSHASSGPRMVWSSSILAGVYALTFTPHSSVTGDGIPVVLPWLVSAVATDDPGAWAPKLRSRVR